MPATYEPIASQTLGSSAASVTFSDIPGTYTDLVLLHSPRASNEGKNIMCRINGDTGSNYSSTYVYGNGTSALSGRNSNQTSFGIGRPYTDSVAMVAHFMSYSNTSVHKTILTSTGGDLVMRVVHLWRSTSAITSLTLFMDDSLNLQSGSTFSLYGIKAA